MLPVSLDCYFSLPLRYYLTFICLVYPMMPVSLDCSFSLPLRDSLTFFCPVSCVPNVASFSGLSFFITLQYSLTFICPVSCVPYVASFSGLSFFITPSVFSNIYLSCVLCTQCCQFLLIVPFFYPFGIL